MKTQTINSEHKKLKKELKVKYNNMKARCKYSKYYIEKQIKIIDEWDEFENFLQWALESGYKTGLTLDRINNLGNYSPENCRWVTFTEQQCNKNYCKENVSGYTGVLWHKASNKWRSIIMVNNKNIHLGTFDNIESALMARNIYIEKNGLKHKIQINHERQDGGY